MAGHDLHHHVRSGQSATNRAQAPLPAADRWDCLQDGPVGPVGLEVEAHCVDLADPLRRPDWDELTARSPKCPLCPAAASITVEPGGAVELSGPPADGPMPAIAAMTADRAVLRAAFAQAGLGLVLLGADPLRPTRRVNPGDRYRAMERSYRQPDRRRRCGDDDVDSVGASQPRGGPADGWAGRVRLAHALGPTMIGMFANSPLLGENSPDGSPPDNGCGASWTRRAVARSSAQAVTTRPRLGPVCAAGARDAGPQRRGRGGGDELGPVAAGPTARCRSATAGRRKPT